MITLASFACAMMRMPSRERSIVKMVAFLGRYGRQPASEVMKMPISFALALMDEVGQMLDDENFTED